jgi:hypothetical protein
MLQLSQLNKVEDIFRFFKNTALYLCLTTVQINCLSGTRIYKLI